MKPEALTPEEEREIDDITDTTIDHPVGTGIGATSGALAGAAAGIAAGPVGMTIGAVVGAVAGGALGHKTAATISPTDEERYWSEHHTEQGFAAEEDFTYEDYSPAYRLGYEGPQRYGTTFEAAENAMRTDWDEKKGDSRLDWPQARQAARAGWERVTGTAATMPPPI